MKDYAGFLKETANVTGALDDTDQAHLTQAWLAGGDEPETQVSGGYFYHLHPLAPNPQGNDAALQDRLIAMCAELSDITFPTDELARFHAVIGVTPKAFRLTQH